VFTKGRSCCARDLSSSKQNNPQNNAHSAKGPGVAITEYASNQKFGAFSQQIRFCAAGKSDVGGEYAVYMMAIAAQGPAKPAFGVI
jgi:hypothetical protein